MTARIGYSTPLLQVADVARSLRFYRTLGFEIVDVEGDGDSPGWARVHCEGGAIMFLLAEEPVDPAKQSVLFALYTPDLPALRARLLADGLAPSPIRHPDYMPSGELQINDPDGYVILINQWSTAEDEPWEAGRKQRLARFGFS
ncbi:MAG: VOC family protein [Thermoanaerobaculia bacterium]